MLDIPLFPTPRCRMSSLLTDAMIRWAWISDASMLHDEYVYGATLALPHKFPWEDGTPVFRQGVAVWHWICSSPRQILRVTVPCPRRYSPIPGMDAPQELTFPPSLADLSRNASVISSSSDSETSTTTVLRTPRPRPTRTFSSPRSRSPNSPPSQNRLPPAYMTRELGVSDVSENRHTLPDSVPVARQAQARSKSRRPSRSQNPSANTRLSAQDFVFGETLGEGSYSTVRNACCCGSQRVITSRFDR